MTTMLSLVFDLALCINVPGGESTDVRLDLFFGGKYQFPPVDKTNFKTLLEIATWDALMLTHDGYYPQKDGLTIGSTPAPPLANG